MSKLELRGISKAFGKAKVLHGIEAQIAEGEFFSIVGPSGCGKTTLLRLIAGLEQPDEGLVLIDGSDVSGREPAERGVGMVFQNYALFPHLTAAANITFGLRGRLPRAGIRERLAEIADLLELDADLLGRRPRQLSGGQRQRVALGRALIRRPRVLLMDEPLSGADALLRDRMRAELRGFHERARATTVYVTHDQREAMSMSDRLMVLDAGRVQQIGRPIEVYRTPGTAFAARFLGSPGMNLWPMAVVPVSDGLRLEGAGAAGWVIPGATADALPAEVLVGIRPERMRLGGGGQQPSLPCRVTGVEPQGETVLLRTRYGEADVAVMVTAAEAETAHGAVRLSFDLADLHFFAASGGRRLSPPGPGRDGAVAASGGRVPGIAGGAR